MCYTLPEKPALHQTRAKVWTKRGLIFLGTLIRQSREEKKISLEAFSQLIYNLTGETVAKKTLHNVENAQATPTWNTLAAIAAVRLVRNPESGQTLKEEDFINIASEFYRPKIMRVSKLIELAIALNNLTVREISSRLRIMCTKGLADISEEQFVEITKGDRLPTDDELRIIRELVDPDEQAFSEKEWLEAAELLK